MKIIIHSLDELLQLSELVLFGKAPREVRIDNKVEIDVADGDPVARGQVRQALLNGKAEPQGLPADIAGPDIATRTFDTLQRTDASDGEENDDLPGIDADGAPYNADWHSDPAKLTGKGLWRARRGRDEDAYKAWLLEQTAEATEAAIRADEAEPVATETHALPQDGPELRSATGEVLAGPAVEADNEGLRTFQEMAGTASTVDLEALIAASLEAVQDASDDHLQLINACRDFTTKHGHPAFTALKAAVAPDGAGGGKSVQLFDSDERRLMRACIANYPSKES